jgi:foldase protein PrsA
MTRLRSILALGAFFVLAPVLAACGSGVPGNSVAVVAGNPISVQAFNHWMYVVAKGQSSSSPSTPVIVPNDPPNFASCIAEARKEIPALAKTPAKTLRADCTTLFTTLSSRVMDTLIKANAHKLGIKVTDAQVQKALVAAKKQQFSTVAEFDAYLKSTGQTLADIIFLVRVSQVYEKLVAKHPTTVTSAQVAAYYTSHQSQFGTPESLNLRIVLAKSQALGQAAKTALQHGASWKVVAKKYSTDPTTKNTGGVLTDVIKGQQDAALDQAAFSAPADKLLGPVKGQFGYYVLEVTKITPATLKTLAQSTASIKQTLTSQLSTAAATAVNNRAKKDWFKQTTCRSLYAMADCSGYKAPKTTTSSSAAASTTG